MSTSSTDTELSVVVIAFTGGAALRRCVEALRHDADAGRMETLVVFDPEGRIANDVADLQRTETAIAWTPAFPGATVPQMRMTGLRKARGAIIALTEDDCVVEPGWCEAVVRAHCSGDAVIGGAVEPGPYRRARDWAVYFCEYGRFMRPLRPLADAGLSLACNNITYKREVLDRLPTPSDAFYDVVVHRAWKDAGVLMRTDETLVIQNVNFWSLKHLTEVPFHHGRTFAAHRLGGRSWPVRVLFAAMAPTLPVLQIGRIARHSISRHRFRGRLLQALPWIMLFNTCWAAGEAIGALIGAGRSAAEWR